MSEKETARPRAQVLARLAASAAKGGRAVVATYGAEHMSDWHSWRLGGRGQVWIATLFRDRGAEPGCEEKATGGLAPDE